MSKTQRRLYPGPTGSLFSNVKRLLKHVYRLSFSHTFIELLLAGYAWYIKLYRKHHKLHTSIICSRIEGVHVPTLVASEYPALPLRSSSKSELQSN